VNLPLVLANSDASRASLEFATISGTLI